MLSIRNFSYFLLTAIAILLWVGGFQAPLQAQQPDWEDDFKTTASPGRRIFGSTCAGCHGLDGRGSEKAPNIATSPKVERLSDTQISSVISNGVPGTGMPAFHSLSPAQVRALVSYLHVLQGRVQVSPLPGNPERGMKIFFAKGECSTCHAISGEGGFLGPDLSTYGSQLSAKAILDSILNPARVVPSGYKSATATTKEGDRVEGVVRNEDNFSVQLQTADGSFHFFQKSELRSLEYLGHSLMPANYGERLTRDELNDLASYLTTTAGTSKAPAPARHKEQ